MVAAGTNLQTRAHRADLHGGRRWRPQGIVTQIRTSGKSAISVPVGRLLYMSGNPVAAPTLVLMGSVLPEYGKFRFDRTLAAARHRP